MGVQEPKAVALQTGCAWAPLAAQGCSDRSSSPDTLLAKLQSVSVPEHLHWDHPLGKGLLEIFLQMRNNWPDCQHQGSSGLLPPKLSSNPEQIFSEWVGLPLRMEAVPQALPEFTLLTVISHFSFRA